MVNNAGIAQVQAISDVTPEEVDRIFRINVQGVLWGIQFGQLYASSASGESLAVIAAVVVGGVSISGGSGTVIGAAIGALFLGLINNALVVLNLPQEWLNVIYGAVILLAVATDALIQVQALRARARSRQR